MSGNLLEGPSMKPARRLDLIIALIIFLTEILRHLPRA